jgi:hypothetical protein
MGKAIDMACFTGIIKPGDIFILCEEADPGADAGPIEYMYSIRSIEEIAPAVEMVMEIILAEMYEYKHFLGVRKKDCQIYEILLMCYDKAGEEEINYSLYLHKIQTFEENLRDVKQLFGIS